ncbi:MAG: TylF/MycF/NovP-related O-methyltransferase [Candidatus Paceibacterota bacterium]|jgi:O-methyltransferase
MIKKLIKKGLLTAGLEIKRKLKGGPDPIHLWETEEHFNSLYSQVNTHTLVSRVRCFILYKFFSHTRTLPGDVAEVGVYRGGTAKFLALLNGEYQLNKNIYLFDTFGGMPETSAEKDLHKEGDFSDTSLEGVLAYLKGLQRISLHRGLFPGTAGPVKDKKFSFVHLDVDIYKSVLDCCDFFYPRMVQGGIIIFDDYGFVSCPGAKLAVDEFFKDKKETPVYLQSGQCLIIKL